VPLYFVFIYSLNQFNKETDLCYLQPSHASTSSGPSQLYLQLSSHHQHNSLLFYTLFDNKRVLTRKTSYIKFQCNYHQIWPMYYCTPHSKHAASSGDNKNQNTRGNKLTECTLSKLAYLVIKFLIIYFIGFNIFY
jgi:hypothetical protein